MDLEAVQEVEIEVEETGLQGYSAYEVAVQNGFVGTETEWLASLKGTDGQDGATGPQGPQGFPGINGTDGTNATINGVSTINIAAGENITLDQEDGTLTINSTGGGTTDYTNLENKPSINNVPLSGNKTSSDLGLQPAGNYLTSETDPVFSASASAGITSTDITNWNSKYDKPSGGIPSTDLSSAVQTSLGKADTALQSYTEQYTGTITSVKMNGSTIASSGEADLGTVITSHQDISGKQDVMQFSTMPTADSTTVGKIIQYVGTTTNDYTNGYFYIGTTDGAVTPIYGWNNINVQASSGAVNTTLKFKIPQNEMQYANKPYTSVSDYNISNTTWKNAIKDFLQQMYNAGQDSFNMIFYGNNGATSKVYYNFSNNQSTAFLSTKPTQIEMYSFEPYFANNCDYNPIRLNITSIVWDGNTISSFTAKMNKFTTTPYLAKNNGDTYTPTQNYHPATKKYVDDSITTAITTTLGGSY